MPEQVYNFKSGNVVPAPETGAQNTKIEIPKISEQQASEIIDDFNQQFEEKVMKKINPSLTSAEPGRSLADFKASIGSNPA